MASVAYQAILVVNLKTGIKILPRCLMQSNNCTIFTYSVLSNVNKITLQSIKQDPIKPSLSWEPRSMEMSITEQEVPYDNSMKPSAV